MELDITLLKEICERINAAIRQSGKSYGEISAETGIPKSALQRYATGETLKVPLDRIILIADATGVDKAWLMGWDEKKSLPSEKNGKTDLINEIIKELASLNEKDRLEILSYIHFLKSKYTSEET